MIDLRAKAKACGWNPDGESLRDFIIGELHGAHAVRQRIAAMDGVPESDVGGVVNRVEHMLAVTGRAGLKSVYACWWKDDDVPEIKIVQDTSHGAAAMAFAMQEYGERGTPCPPTTTGAEAVMVCETANGDTRTVTVRVVAEVVDEY